MLAHACMLAQCHDKHVEHANRSKHAGFINPTRHMSGIKRNILSKREKQQRSEEKCKDESKEKIVAYDVCGLLACVLSTKKLDQTKSTQFSQKLVKINQFEPRGPFLSLDREEPKKQNKQIDMEPGHALR